MKTLTKERVGMESRRYAGHSIRRSLVRSFVVVSALLIVSGCNLIAAYNGMADIDFHPGVHDKYWNSVDKVKDNVLFTGGWGKKTTDEVMSQYNFQLNSKWFFIRNITLAEGGGDYKEIWNYIDEGTDVNDVRNSVLHTKCHIEFSASQLARNMNTMPKTTDCRFIVESKPASGGKMHHKIWLTVFYDPNPYARSYHVDQLNIYMEADDSSITLVYL